MFSTNKRLFESIPTTERSPDFVDLSISTIIKIIMLFPSDKFGYPNFYGFALSVTSRLSERLLHWNITNSNGDRAINDPLNICLLRACPFFVKPLYRI